MTYAKSDMVSRIENELGGRTDLATEIGLAINSAIFKFQREQFYFNQLRSTGAFTTVYGQEFYTSSDAAIIGTLPHIDKLSVLISGNRYFMVGRTEQYMEDVSMSPTNYGQPVDWSYYQQRIRMYPIPDGAYPVNILCFNLLTLTGDYNNAWTNDAEELIRCEAKRDIMENLLYDDEGAARMKRQIYGDPEQPGSEGYLYALKAQTARSSATRRIRPTNF